MEALFIGGVVFGLFGIGAVSSDPTAGWSFLLLGAALIATALYVGTIFERQRAFGIWLFDNADAIAAGTARFGEKEIRSETPVVFVHLVTSALVVTGARTIGPLLLDDPTLARSRSIVNAVTVATGWWSLLGLMRTPVALTSNGGGGVRSTVGEYLKYGDEVASIFGLGPA
jgi:hypothetical protein